MTTTRDPKGIVLEAELLASSPEQVRAWLVERAKEERRFRRDDGGDLERVLLERGDALITLSLARYCASVEVARAILTGPARGDKALRLALLMNEPLGRVGLIGMPCELLEKDQPVDKFLAALDVEEIWALFSNRYLSEDFLVDFFEQKAPWQALDDERRYYAIACLGDNPRMQASYDGNRYYHTWTKHTHNQVLDAAWELSEKLPVTRVWADTLSWLYEKLDPGLALTTIKNPLELAARWVPDPADAKQIEEEKKDLERGTLGSFARVRKNIAGLAVAGSHSQEERRALANHADPAVRAAFYAGVSLSRKEEMEAGERDPLLSFKMMENPAVWRTKAHCKLLEKMARDNVEAHGRGFRHRRRFEFVPVGWQGRWAISENGAPKLSWRASLSNRRCELHLSDGSDVGKWETIITVSPRDKTPDGKMGFEHRDGTVKPGYMVSTGPNMLAVYVAVSFENFDRLLASFRAGMLPTLTFAFDSTTSPTDGRLCGPSLTGAITETEDVTSGTTIYRWDNTQEDADTVAAEACEFSHSTSFEPPSVPELHEPSKLSRSFGVAFAAAINIAAIALAATAFATVSTKFQVITISLLLLLYVVIEGGIMVIRHNVARAEIFAYKRFVMLRTFVGLTTTPEEGQTLWKLEEKLDNPGAWVHIDVLGTGILCCMALYKLVTVLW
jgi:hypothetical protein